MSMGGFGTFQTACEFPHRFSAIIPVAGDGNIENAEQLKNVPTWAFHGDGDDVVSYECSAK
jgi:predicted peptidase